MAQRALEVLPTQRYLHLLTEDLSASHQKVSILSLRQLLRNAGNGYRTHVLTNMGCFA